MATSNGTQTSTRHRRVQSAVFGGYTKQDATVLHHGPGISVDSIQGNVDIGPRRRQPQVQTLKSVWTVTLPSISRLLIYYPRELYKDVGWFAESIPSSPRWTARSPQADSDGTDDGRKCIIRLVSRPIDRAPRTPPETTKRTFSNLLSLCVAVLWCFPLYSRTIYTLSFSCFLAGKSSSRVTKRETPSRY